MKELVVISGKGGTGKTTVAANLLDWDGQTGAIAAGYFADIIAVSGNPLDDISVLEDVFFVMKDGIVYKHNK